MKIRDFRFADKSHLQLLLLSYTALELEISGFAGVLIFMNGTREGVDCQVPHRQPFQT